MPKSPNIPMKWTPPQERALLLAFEGRWSQEEIADKLREEFDDGSEKFRISTRALRGWLAHPEFQQRLASLQSDFAVSIRDVVYADKARRIIGLSQMAEQARRQYEEHELLIELRPTKDGMITIERFNRDAHDAARGAMDDIAKELGQRKNVTELTGKDGGPIEVNDARERLITRLATLAERRRAAGSPSQSE